MDKIVFLPLCLISYSTFAFAVAQEVSLISELSK